MRYFNILIIFLFLIPTFGLAQEEYDKSKVIDSIDRQIPSKPPENLNSLPEGEYRKYMRSGIQYHYSTFLKKYAEEYDMDVSQFPYHVPDQIMLRLRAVPIEVLKASSKDTESQKRGKEQLEKQFRVLLDKFRAGEDLSILAKKMKEDTAPAEGEEKKALAEQEEPEDIETRIVPKKESVPFYKNKDYLIYALLGTVFLLVLAYSIKKK